MSRRSVSGLLKQGYKYLQVLKDGGTRQKLAARFKVSYTHVCKLVQLAQKVSPAEARRYDRKKISGHRVLQALSICDAAARERLLVWAYRLTDKQFHDEVKQRTTNPHPRTTKPKTRRAVNYPDAIALLDTAVDFGLETYALVWKDELSAESRRAEFEKMSPAERSEMVRRWSALLKKVELQLHLYGELRSDLVSESQQDNVDSTEQQPQQQLRRSSRAAAVEYVHGLIGDHRDDEDEEGEEDEDAEERGGGEIDGQGCGEQPGGVGCNDGAAESKEADDPDAAGRGEVLPTVLPDCEHAVDHEHQGSDRGEACGGAVQGEWRQI